MLLASISSLAVLMKIVADLGLLKTILIGMVVLGLYFGVKFIGQYKFTRKVEESGIKVADETDLSYHPFFNKAVYFLTHALPQIDVFNDKPVRRQLMIDLLKIHYTAILEGCRQIAELDMKKWSSDKWTTEITRRFNDMFYQANQKARESGIPEVVIDKFKKWYSPAVDTVFEHITWIGSPTTYNTNALRTNTLFMMTTVMLSSMLGDAERTITKLNGDITGIKYKGKVIEPIGH